MNAKQRFLENKAAVEAHAELTASNSFRSACDAAMIELSNSLGSASDMNHAAANAYRMEGARAYLQKLLTLADSEPERRTTEKHLNYKA